MTVREPAPSDEALALRAQQGERQAFDLLIGRHKDLLYRLVRRYVGDGDEAYDILQDALISVWEGLHRFDTGRPFVAWARVIALNKCRDFSRRRQFRRLVHGAFALEPAPVPPLSASEQVDMQFTAAQQDLRLRRLAEAIAALPVLYKEPFVLTTSGGLTQMEAASVLRTTTKAIEMRLRRARASLAQTLGPAPEG